MTYHILTINPGSTSSKLALFANETEIAKENIVHDPEQLDQFSEVWDQLPMRTEAVLEFLADNKFSVDQLDAIASRGGLFKPVPGGVYPINAVMLADAKNGFQGQHASNLGCAIAHELAQVAKIPAFVIDPISVDEFEPLARHSGHPLIQRKSLSHALNIHALGRKAAAKLNVDVQTVNFIIVHLGGGISVCPLKQGRIIDVNDASNEGPFSPERTGGLPTMTFLELCYSEKFTRKEMKKNVMGHGGLMAYLGTNNARDVEKRIADGDEFALEIYEAMAYQIAKEIGAMATVLNGNVEAIVISGGLVGSKMLMKWIINRVSFISKHIFFPGELEMEALAVGALRVLHGEEAPAIYL